MREWLKMYEEMQEDILKHGQMNSRKERESYCAFVIVSMKREFVSPENI
jgi:acyl-CoA thioesterase FadM